MAKPFPKIDANPTKRFFISMLVRDIQLLEAIVDLVDNSVDGARQLRPAGSTKPGSKRYKNLVIELTLNDREFRIEDNCGGIDAKHAQEYVFNFGRKDDFPSVEGQIGEFGVGMKRALFKLGMHFRIESQSARSRFVVDVPVATWEGSSEVPWEFEFEDYRPKLPQLVPELDRYTRIKVTELHEGVIEQFKLGRVQNELSVALGQQHQASLEQGLEILVNGHSVTRRRPVLIFSSDIKPIRRQFPIDDLPVNAELYVGLSDSGEQASAGWYVYCNDRLVVSADKTALTGWDRAAGGSIPAYHPQYRRFRGYAFLSTDDPGMLPWNTTKTSVDPNSRVYRLLLTEMLPAMQQVISVIDEADEEMDSFPRGGGPINKAIRNAGSVALAQVPMRDKFEVRVARAPKAATTVSVQYRVDRERMDAVQEVIGLSSASQVGIATFDYYYDSEVE